MYAKSNFKNYTTMQELNLFSVLESYEQTTSEKENLVKVSHRSYNPAIEEQREFEEVIFQDMAEIGFLENPQLDKVMEYAYAFANYYTNDKEQKMEVCAQYANSANRYSLAIESVQEQYKEQGYLPTFEEYSSDVFNALQWECREKPETQIRYTKFMQAMQKAYKPEIIF